MESNLSETQCAETGHKEEEVLASVNKTPFINRKKVKEFALDYCQHSSRIHVRKNMRRVSGDFMVALDVFVREWIRKRVDSQPSIGKTLR